MPTVGTLQNLRMNFPSWFSKIAWQVKILSFFSDKARENLMNAPEGTQAQSSRVQDSDSTLT